jgi:hypothetical protein
MERAFLNYKEGRAVCCWSAPSRKHIEELFKTAGAKYESISEVEEFTPAAFED